MFLFVRRYLFAKKSHSVVNIIASLSLISIALPVAAIITLLSVFNGFGEMLSDASRLFDADLTIARREGRLFDVEAIDSAALVAVDGVEAISFAAEQSMLFEHNGNQSVAVLRGVDDNFTNVVPFDESIFKGEYQTSLGEIDRLILGNALAYQLGVRTMLDTYIELYALKQNTFSPLLPMANYNKRSIKLSSLYSATLESEQRYAITSIRAVQNLLSAKGKATEIFVKLESGAKQSRTKAAIEQLLGEEYTVKSRYDLNPMIYDIVEYEKWGLLFISVLIMGLASFSLIGALSMLIIEKRGDIATLRAMGGSWQFIRSIFFGEGMLITTIGVVVGCCLGCTVTMLQEWFGFVKIPSQSSVALNYPVELMASDVVAVALISLSLSALLSYLVTRLSVKN